MHSNRQVFLYNASTDRTLLCSVPGIYLYQLSTSTLGLVLNCTCCIFLAFEPSAGKRVVCVKELRTKVDYANFMKMLANQYLEADKILLVQDNLNTHTAGSFYDALHNDAFMLAKRFEYHYTPKKKVGLIWEK